MKMVDINDELDNFFKDKEEQSKNFKLLIDFKKLILEYTSKPMKITSPPKMKKKTSMKQVDIKTVNRRKNKKDLF